MGANTGRPLAQGLLLALIDRLAVQSPACTLRRRLTLIAVVNASGEKFHLQAHT